MGFIEIYRDFHRDLYGFIMIYRDFSEGFSWGFS